MWRWVRQLPLVFGRDTRRLVGEDAHGNRYYELLSGTGTPSPSATATTASRPRRMVISPAGEPEDFETEGVPVQWSAWLAGRREEPPSAEELARAVHQQAVLQTRVAELEQREAEAQQTAQLETRSDELQGDLNHAAVRSYRRPQATEEPSSGAGSTFQPGSWDPSRPPK